MLRGQSSKLPGDFDDLHNSGGIERFAGRFCPRAGQPELELNRIPCAGRLQSGNLFRGGLHESEPLLCADFAF